MSGPATALRDGASRASSRLLGPQAFIPQTLPELLPGAKDGGHTQALLLSSGSPAAHRMSRIHPSLPPSGLQPSPYGPLP